MNPRIFGTKGAIDTAPQLGSAPVVNFYDANADSTVRSRKQCSIKTWRKRCSYAGL